ncbi:hypothetical protein C8Q79DRAFT_204138 [Trametes meyenii]|nr:hypothetical protein C8Q79DRAFT_204138 [Trametes meyenii]
MPWPISHATRPDVSHPGYTDSVRFFLARAAHRPRPSPKADGARQRPGPVHFCVKMCAHTRRSMRSRAFPAQSPENENPEPGRSLGTTPSSSTSTNAAYRLVRLHRRRAAMCTRRHRRRLLLEDTDAPPAKIVAADPAPFSPTDACDSSGIPGPAVGLDGCARLCCVVDMTPAPARGSLAGSKFQPTSLDRPSRIHRASISRRVHPSPTSSHIPSPTELRSSCAMRLLADVCLATNSAMPPAALPATASWAARARFVRLSRDRAVNRAAGRPSLASPPASLGDLSVLRPSTPRLSRIVRAGLCRPRRSLQATTLCADGRALPLGPSASFGISEENVERLSRDRRRAQPCVQASHYRARSRSSVRPGRQRECNSARRK